MFSPRSDQVIGDAQKKALQYLLSSNTFPETIMFIGQSGSGKTTVAKLLAEHLKSDIREINCSSETGIQNVRDIIDTFPLKPLGSKFNIIFLDELHGLSTSAQNALLTPLETLPKNTIILAATTEPKKIIKTLFSRFTKYTFTSPSDKEISQLIINHLTENKIAIDTYPTKPDGYEVEVSGSYIKDAIKRSNGNLREVFKYLDSIVEGTYTPFINEDEPDEESLVKQLLWKNRSLSSLVGVAREVKSYYGETRGMINYCISVLSNNDNDKAAKIILYFGDVLEAGSDDIAKARFFKALIRVVEGE